VHSSVQFTAESIEDYCKEMTIAIRSLLLCVYMNNSVARYSKGLDSVDGLRCCSYEDILLYHHK